MKPNINKVIWIKQFYELSFIPSWTKGLLTKLGGLTRGVGSEWSLSGVI